MGIGVVTNIQFPSNCHLCSPLFTSLFNTLCHPTRLSTSRELILHAAWQWFLITGGWVQVFTIVGYKRPEDSTSFYISSTSTSGVTQSWPFGSGTQLWYWAQAGTCSLMNSRNLKPQVVAAGKERSGCLLSKSVHIRTLFYCQRKISSSNDGAHLSLDKYIWEDTNLTSAEVYMHLQMAFNVASHVCWHMVNSNIPVGKIKLHQRVEFHHLHLRISQGGVGRVGSKTVLRLS